ncbi:MAG: aldo/keto reductase [Actinobacteria bacterium]|nr:aldo/keto reductase [Actinomycetota bacterium]
METRRLGRSGPEMSAVGYGAWEAGAGSEWGEPPPEEQVIEAIRAVLDTGMNWIDAAEVYGKGRSEEVVGRAIAGRRDEVLVATKVAPGPEGTGFRPEEVRRACEASLKRLSTDRIDLYQLHWPDETGVPVEETWAAMASLVEDGLVRFIGVSNFGRKLIERCLAVRHVDSLQQEFSILQLENRDLIRWCGERGIGVLSYGPLAYGLLTGAIGLDTRFAPTDFRSGFEEWDYWQKLFAPGKIERSLAVVDGLRGIAERLGVTVAQITLAWNFHQAGVTAAIAGSRNPEHVRQNAEAGDVRLDEATLAELEEVIRLGPSFGDRDTVV